MAALSDQLLVVTILAYLAAMLGYAAEYAFGVRGPVARVAHRAAAPADEVAVVPAGAAAAPAEAAGVSVAPGAAPGVSTGQGPSAKPASARDAALSRLLGRLAVALTLVGALSHTGILLTRALAAGRVPWGNMYEFLIALCLVGVGAWLVVLYRRPAVRPLGLFVTLALVVLLGSAGMSLYTAAGPLVPALNSYWLAIHVSAAATAAGILLVGFVAAVLYLLRAGYEDGRTGFPYALAARAPAAETLERLTFRVHAFAFPIWTFAVICGAIWAEAAWGRYWGWDPKETWSFITWVIYAGYLHARATPSVRRRTATLIAIAGWAALVFNVYGVNLVFSGLHSYSGVD